MSVEQETTDGIRIITMDDGKVNAVSHALLDELEPALAEAGADDTIRGVVLAGRPGKFSGGFDLAIMQGGNAARMQELVVRGGRLVPKIYGFPKPFVAATTGHAVAMGAVILLASDYRVGAQGAFKIGLNENAIGLVLPVFATELARVRISPGHMTASILGAQLFDPDGAMDAGFLDEVCPEDRLVERAVERAAMLARHPVQSYAGNKLRMREETIRTIEASL